MLHILFGLVALMLTLSTALLLYGWYSPRAAKDREIERRRQEYLASLRRDLLEHALD